MAFMLNGLKMVLMSPWLAELLGDVILRAIMEPDSEKLSSSPTSSLSPSPPAPPPPPPPPPAWSSSPSVCPSFMSQSATLGGITEWIICSFRLFSLPSCFFTISDWPAFMKVSRKRACNLT